MVKFLQLLQKSLNGFFAILIVISLLTWFGAINPFEYFQNGMSSRVEDSLEAKSLNGDADAQNRLGTLLYTRAQKQKGDFSDAIIWLERAAEQQHAVAQTNLGFAYKAGNGVALDHEKAIELFYNAGLSFLKMGFPMDARDNVYDINHLNSEHPLKRALMKAIKEYEQKD